MSVDVTNGLVYIPNQNDEALRDRGDDSLEGKLLVAPDRFVQGLFVGAIIATVVALALTYLGVLVG